jgi:hypothetical protein
MINNILIIIIIIIIIIINIYTHNTQNDNFTNINNLENSNIEDFTNINNLEKSNIEENSCNIEKNSKKTSCTAKDNVNDPAYNMKNIIIQNILLEEHLACENKYCEPCIVKHFLHIIGLSEEAVWMAGDNIDIYPLLNNSVNFYKKLFNEWHINKSDKNVILKTLGTLRKQRQELIEYYYFAKKI